MMTSPSIPITSVTCVIRRERRRPRDICISFTHLQSTRNRAAVDGCGPTAQIGSGVMAWRYRRQAMAMMLLAAALVPAERAGAADTIDVVLDQAKIVKLPDRVGTIVVGNPLI